MPSVLVIDNYDSFTYNLVQYLGELGAEVGVVRNDKATVDELVRLKPDRLVVSPGPCTPKEAGISVDAIRTFAEAGTPVLGVCLGHQSMVEAFGGKVVRGDPIHGKDAEVKHDGRSIYEGLSNPLVAGRYHSLIADPDLPDELELTSTYGDVVMGVRHRELPAEGVQFHPSPSSPRRARSCWLTSSATSRAPRLDAQRHPHTRDRRDLRRHASDRGSHLGRARGDHGGTGGARSRSALS